MITYRIDTLGAKVVRYDDPLTAIKNGNGGTLVSSEEELAKSGVLMSTMVKLHNIANEERPVAKFADRETAAKRLWPLLQKLSEPAKVPSLPTEEPNMAKTTKKTTKTPATKKAVPAPAKAPSKAVRNTTGLKGKTSQYAGKMISLSAKTKGENVRKEGTGGYAAMEIVRKAGKISYEDFIQKGGGRNHLAWDLERGNYELK